MADSIDKASISPLPAPYRLESVLSRRSSTVTSAVVDTRSCEPLILKRLELGALKSLDELERFEREAELMGQLDHPGLPRLLEYRREQGPTGLSLVLISQRLPGTSLAQRLHEGWRPEQAQLRDIARQALELLKVVHASGVLHRDLKPDNLLLDDSGRLSLVDFGAARHQLRGSATVAGTFGYLAPEQFYGRSLPESDLYGLGATLIHLLTGRHPADLPREGLKLRWRELASGDEALLDWVDGLVEPDPDQRPATALEALDLLDGKAQSVQIPRDEGSTWPRIRRQRMGRHLILTVAGEGLSASLKSLALFNLPMLALLGLSLLLMGLGELMQLVAIVVGILSFFWCTAVTVLILADSLRRNQVWLGPDKLHVFARAIDPLTYASAPLPKDLKLRVSRSSKPGVHSLEQIRGVQVIDGFPKELGSRGAIRRWLGSFASSQVEIRVDYQRQLLSIPAFQGLTQAQALWLQREMLNWLLRHQPESIARQALLQLQHNQKMQQALEEDN